MSKKKRTRESRRHTPAESAQQQGLSALEVADQLKDGKSDASKHALAAFCKMDAPPTAALKDWPPVEHLATVLRLYNKLPYYQDDEVTRERNAQFSLEVLGALAAIGADKKAACTIEQNQVTIGR